MSVMLAGCGGSGSPVTPSSSTAGQDAGTAPAPSDGTLSVDERSQVMLQVGDKLDSIVEQDPNADLSALVAYMQTLPQFSAVSLDAEGNAVAALFTDGVALTIVNNRPAADGAGKVTRTPASRAATGDTPARSFTVADNSHFNGVARGRNVHLLSGLGSAFQDISGHLAQIFGTAQGMGANYSLSIEEASLEQIASLKGSATGQDALVYFDAHGGPALAPGPGGTVPVHEINDWSMGTTSYLKRDPANPNRFLPDSHYKQLLDPNSGVCLFFARYNSPADVPSDAFSVKGKTKTREYHYGITSRFITANNIQFGADSMVYVDACKSDGPLAQSFKNACLKGAAVYVGWSASVSDGFSDVTAQYLLDRMLGANVFNPPSPAQRPFDWPSVYAHMQSQNLTVNTAYKGAVLNIYGNPSNGDLGIFAPSIESMAVDESGPTLTLTGIFGNDQGSVSMAGQPLTVKSWAASTITCTLPATGGGTVIVTAEGQKSNAVPLTVWSQANATLTDVFSGSWDLTKSAMGSDFSQIIQQYQRSMNGTFALRCDVHGSRSTPDGPLTGGATTSGKGRVDSAAATGKLITVLNPPPGQTEVDDRINAQIGLPVQNALAITSVTLDPVARSGSMSASALIPKGIEQIYNGNVVGTMDLAIATMSAVKLSLDPSSYVVTATGNTSQNYSATTFPGEPANMPGIVPSGGGTVTLTLKPMTPDSGTTPDSSTRH